MPASGFVVPYTSGQTSAQIAQALSDAFNTATITSKPTIGTGLIVREASISQIRCTRQPDRNHRARVVLFTNNSGRIEPRTTAEPGDVDFFSAELLRGATVSTTVAGNGFTSLLRVFDNAGNELTLARAGNTSTFTVPSDGTYYFGISASSNGNYYPTVAGTAAPDAASGAYTLTIDVTNALRANLVGNRVQFAGGANVNVNGNAIYCRRSGWGWSEQCSALHHVDDDCCRGGYRSSSGIGAKAANGATAYDLYPRQNETLIIPGLNVSDDGPFVAISPTANSNARSINNNFEGIYLDDFIIGVAERGENRFERSTRYNVFCESKRSWECNQPRTVSIRSSWWGRLHCCHPDFYRLCKLASRSMVA